MEVESRKESSTITTLGTHVTIFQFTDTKLADPPMTQGHLGGQGRSIAKEKEASQVDSGIQQPELPEMDAEEERKIDRWTGA